MEDFTSYIWILGLIIAFLISAFKKKKAVHRDEEEEKKGFFEEMLEQINEMKREDAPVAEASAKTEAMQAKKYVPKVYKNKSNANVASSCERVIKSRKTEFVTSVDDENDIVADFDLRKAVLYSEIMNPKFNE